MMSQIFATTIKRTTNVIRYCYSTDVVKIAFTSYNKHKSTEVPLVIMHGIFGSRRNYIWLCNLLEQHLVPHRRIITVDCRNHGDSGQSKVHNYEVIANDMIQFLKENNLDKIIFMGNTMGGRAAMYMALKHTQYIDKIIILDAGPLKKVAMYKVANHLKSIADTPMKKGSLMDARSELQKFLMTTDLTSEDRVFIVSNLIEKNGVIQWRSNVKVIVDNHENIITFPIPVESGLKYTGPALFIAGKSSQTLQDLDRNAIKTMFPNSTIKEMEGVSHRLHVNRPVGLQQIIVDFLK